MNKIISTNQRGYKKSIIAVIGIFILIIWIAFSAIYIINDRWTDFQSIGIPRAYRQGVNDLVLTAMREVSKCAPVTLRDGDKKIEIVAVKCLTVSENNNSQESKAVKEPEPIIEEKKEELPIKEESEKTIEEQPLP